MNILKLYDENGQLINFEVIKFSGGEMHLKFDKKAIRSIMDSRGLSILARITNSEELITLWLLEDHVCRWASCYGGLEVFIPYLPYGRADKYFSRESFGLRLISSHYNNLQDTTLVTLDAHSGFSILEIERLRNLSGHPLISEFFNKCQENEIGYVIVLPDKGAEERNPFLSEDSIVAKKVRDKDGKIISYEFKEEDASKVAGKTVFVVDDICDGGQTFIKCAEALLPYKPKTLNLWVTHGIFRNGLDDIFKYYNKIGCTNSFQDFDSDSSLKYIQEGRLHVYDVFKYDFFT